MIIKKFVAKDFKEALRQAKREMGSDAIILYTNKVKRGGILSFLFSPQVEITVAVDEKLQVNSDRMRKTLSSAAAGSEGSTADIPQPDENNTAKIIASTEPGELLEELHTMKNLINDVKDKIYEIEQIKGISGEVQVFYETLLNNQVEKELALKIVNRVESRLSPNSKEDELWVRDLCLRTIQEYINDIKPIELRPQKKGVLVFMVGPTGVGKTTTIAKLSANMSFLESKEVALITLDTYRVSAAQQLRTFAEIIGIPISVVFNPQDLGEAIKSFQEKDIIFVDTAGRSPYKDDHMEELHEFIKVANPDETILVLSVTTDNRDLINIYQQFNNIGVDKIIFTKLDESYNYGKILNAIYYIRKPIAYLTNGQNVPDDIEVPDALELARRLLREGGAR